MGAMRSVVKSLSIRWDSGGYVPLGTSATGEKKAKRYGCFRMFSLKRLVMVITALLTIPSFLILSSIAVGSSCTCVVEVG